MNPTTAFNSLDDWLPWLESLSPREIVLGLERVDAVLDRLGLARPELVITVAGTNGKGSSVAMLEAILRQQGIQTGCYTSPHVHRYNERTRIDGVAADDASVIAALETVEFARGETPLTFFEYGTLASLVAFDTAGADAWVLEVGMGGRLDAVNAIEPDACLITNVSLDHCAWLGDDLESIAIEKAGVMRQGKPAIFGSTPVPDAIERIALEVGADLRMAGRNFDHDPENGSTWSWQGERESLSGLRRPQLAGDVQLTNASAVMALVESLGRNEWLAVDRVNAALAAASLEGRFQCIDDRFVLDVAHNAAAGEVLAEQLGQDYGDRRVNVIVGMLADKDVAGFIVPIGQIAARFVAVSINESRGALAATTARDIANATGRPCQVIDDLQDALDTTSRQMTGNDVLLVTGSFHIVGPALRWIERKKS